MFVFFKWSLVLKKMWSQNVKKKKKKKKNVFCLISLTRFIKDTLNMWMRVYYWEKIIFAKITTTTLNSPFMYIHMSVCLPVLFPNTYNLKQICILIHCFSIPTRQLLHAGVSNKHCLLTILVLNVIVRKLINRYKRTGYSLDIMRQTACLVVNPIIVDNYTSLFNCTTAVWASDSMTASS